VETSVEWPSTEAGTKLVVVPKNLSDHNKYFNVLLFLKSRLMQKKNHGEQQIKLLSEDNGFPFASDSSGACHDPRSQWVCVGRLLETQKTSGPVSSVLELAQTCRPSLPKLTLTGLLIA
jgi:hypothetical protein